MAHPLVLSLALWDARQGFHWPEAASSARLVVPVTLAEVAVTGGAKAMGEGFVLPLENIYIYIYMYNILLYMYIYIYIFI